MAEDIRTTIASLVGRFGIGRDYHLRCLDRYVKTIELAQRHFEFSENSSVAELGPGMLLAYIAHRYGCDSHAYGLLLGSWQDDLVKMGITTSQWDFNSPLPADHPEDLHDLIFFCEVIEHLYRWPIEVLQDIGRLLVPGGTLVMTTVNLLRVSNRIRVLLGKSPLINKFERTPDGCMHVREYVLDELCYYLAEAGFDVAERRFTGYHGLSLSGRLCGLSGWCFPSTANSIEIVAVLRS